MIKHTNKVGGEANKTRLPAWAHRKSQNGEKSKRTPKRHTQAATFSFQIILVLNYTITAEEAKNKATKQDEEVSTKLRLSCNWKPLNLNFQH